MADRLDYLDISKGFGIIFVVIGHMIDHQGVYMWRLHDFLYTFHVPLFFFISGVLHKESTSFGRNVLKKAKELYFPYLLISLILLICESFREPTAGLLSKHVIIQMIFGNGVAPGLAGPLWFLSVLFRCSIVYTLFSIVAHNSKASKYVICVIWVICGILLPKAWMLKQTAFALFFYSLGHLVNAKGIEYLRIFSSKSSFLIFSSLSVIIVLFLSIFNPVNFAFGQYGNYLLFLFSAIVGIALTLYLSLKLDSKVAIISEIGRNTKWILCFHLVIIRIVIKSFTVVSDMFDITCDLHYISMPLAFSLSLAIPCLITRMAKKAKPFNNKSI